MGLAVPKDHLALLLHYHFTARLLWFPHIRCLLIPSECRPLGAFLFGSFVGYRQNASRGDNKTRVAYGQPPYQLPATRGTLIVREVDKVVIGIKREGQLLWYEQRMVPLLYPTYVKIGTAHSPFSFK